MNFFSKLLTWILPVEQPANKVAKISKPINHEKGEFMWNTKKIKTAVNNLSRELHELKKSIRQPNVQITSQQHTALTNLKDLVTLLCVVRASSRGKVHLAQYSVVCEECHHCCCNGVSSTESISSEQGNRHATIKCSHQGPVSEAAWNDWQCKKCRNWFTILRPMTLEAQDRWLQRNLSASFKAAYGDYVVKP